MNSDRFFQRIICSEQWMDRFDGVIAVQMDRIGYIVVDLLFPNQFFNLISKSTAPRFDDDKLRTIR